MILDRFVIVLNSSSRSRQCSQNKLATFLNCLLKVISSCFCFVFHQYFHILNSRLVLIGGNTSTKPQSRRRRQRWQHCFTSIRRHFYTWWSNLIPKWARIVSKWDRPGTFSDQVSVERKISVQKSHLKKSHICPI